jgi:hypothetical protein
MEASQQDLVTNQALQVLNSSTTIYLMTVCLYTLAGIVTQSATCKCCDKVDARVTRFAQRCAPI